MTKKEIILLSSHNHLAISADIRWHETAKELPVILFLHGFKGFKDWGVFNLVADIFAAQGFVFIKMNFSHNGTTPKQPVDFVDLEAFGHNNFSKELSDVDTVMNYFFSRACHLPLDLEKFYLIGHSRGGGIALLKAYSDSRIAKIVTWAAVKNLEYFFSSINIEQWQQKKVCYVLNGRTKQNMPLYFQLYEDYIRHREQLDIPSLSKKIRQPVLLIHGSQDKTVAVQTAYDLVCWIANARIHIVDGGDHVFGGEHPYERQYLPDRMKRVVEESKEFLLNT